jgi:prefoldin subunit 5
LYGSAATACLELENIPLVTTMGVPTSTTAATRHKRENMKLTARFVVAVLVANLLAPIPSSAQQSLGVSITELREQIAKLEKVDLNPDTSPEVRALNREFLRERRAEFNALLQRRISALRQYLAATREALKPQEVRAVEENIRALMAEAGVSEPEAGSVSTVKVGTRRLAEVAASLRGEAGGGIVRPRTALTLAAETRADATAAETMLNLKSQDAAATPTPTPTPTAEEIVDGLENSDGEVIFVDAFAYRVPKSVEVPNDTAVTVVVKRSPVNTCTIATKREELKPEPDPLAQFLKVVVGAGVITFRKSSTLTTEKAEEICQGVAKVPAPKALNTGLVELQAQRIEDKITLLQDTLIRLAGELAAKQVAYKDLNTRIGKFTRCEDGICLERVEGGTAAKRPEVLSPNFNEHKATLRKSVNREIESEVPSIRGAEELMAGLWTDVKEGYGATAEAAWVKNVTDRLDCLERNLDPIRRRRDDLLSARGELEKFRDLIDNHKTRIYDSKRLINDSGAKVTGTVTCTNYFTKRPAAEQIVETQAGGKEVTKVVEVDPIPFTVTYQDKPAGSVSGGVLFTTLNKRQLGTVTVNTGTAAGTTDGTSSFRTIYGETDTADSQLVPFTFYNHRLWGTHKFSLNGSGGIGINPNNGAAQVEFFFGGAVGVKNFFFQFGGHAGRWQELGRGFTIGDLLPVGTAPVAPIERRYTIRPSAGVSYRLPLP